MIVKKIKGNFNGILVINNTNSSALPHQYNFISTDPINKQNLYSVIIAAADALATNMPVLS